MKYLLLSLLLLVNAPMAYAQEDTIAVPVREQTFKPKQLIAPAILIGFGAWGLADQSPTSWLANKAYEDMNKKGRTCKADEYFQYIPSPVHVLLGLTGIKSKHNLRDRVLASATAHLLMAGITNAAKYGIKEQRPDTDKRNSFFSGHTATAFTGAELMRIDYGWGYGAAAYALATGTAFLRVYNKRHWVGDVLAGAGTGILCANAGYWMLPLWHRLFKIDQKKESKRLIVAAPFYQSEDKAAGLSCSILLE